MSPPTLSFPLSLNFGTVGLGNTPEGLGKEGREGRQAGRKEGPQKATHRHKERNM